MTITDNIYTKVTDYTMTIIDNIYTIVTDSTMTTYILELLILL